LLKNNKEWENGQKRVSKPLAKRRASKEISAPMT